MPGEYAWILHGFPGRKHGFCMDFPGVRECVLTRLAWISGLEGRAARRDISYIRAPPHAENFTQPRAENFIHRGGPARKQGKKEIHAALFCFYFAGGMVPHV